MSNNGCVNSDECEGLHILETKFDMHENRQDSKMENIQTVQNIIMDDRLPKAEKKIRGVRFEFDQLVDVETGKVGVLWSDRKSLINLGKWMIMSLVGLVFTVGAALTVSVITQNYHQNKTDQNMSGLDVRLGKLVNLMEKVVKEEK